MSRVRACFNEPGRDVESRFSSQQKVLRLHKDGGEQSPSLGGAKLGLRGVKELVYYLRGCCGRLVDNHYRGDLCSVGVWMMMINHDDRYLAVQDPLSDLS